MTSRRITALDVQCPSCGEPVGVRCRRLDNAGHETAAHSSRRTAAKRLDAEINPVHVRGQLALWGKA